MDVGFLFLHSNDKFNNPVHLTLTSEGNEIAPAGETLACADWVTAASFHQGLYKQNQ